MEIPDEEIDFINIPFFKNQIPEITEGIFTDRYFLADQNSPSVQKVANMTKTQKTSLMMRLS
jgi:hypothetical protein